VVWPKNTLENLLEKESSSKFLSDFFVINERIYFSLLQSFLPRIFDFILNNTLSVSRSHSISPQSITINLTLSQRTLISLPDVQFSVKESSILISRKYFY